MATWWSGWRSRLALLASALLVPLLVAGAFVWTGWQSSDRLHHNEGVVVNLDQAVTQGGHTYMMGNQLGAQLVGLSGSQFDWDFGVSPSQAQTGLASGRYSVAVVIPKDFSQALLSNGKQRTVLAIQTSPMASVDQKVMANTLAEAAQRGMARQLGSAALNSIYVTFDQVDKDLVTASNKSSDAAASAVSLQTLAGTAGTQAAQVKKDTATVSSGSQSVAKDANNASQQAQTATKSGNAGASTAAKVGQDADAHKTQAGTSATGAGGLGTSVGNAASGAKGASDAATGLGDTGTKIGAANTATGTAVKAAQTSSQQYRQAVAAAAAQQKGLSKELAAISSAATTYTTDVNGFIAAVGNVQTSKQPTAGDSIAASLETDAATMDTNLKTAGTASTYANQLETSYEGLNKWLNQGGEPTTQEQFQSFNDCQADDVASNGFKTILAGTRRMTDLTTADVTFTSPADGSTQRYRADGYPVNFLPAAYACRLYISAYAVGYAAGYSSAISGAQSHLAEVNNQDSTGRDALAALPTALANMSTLPDGLRALANQVRGLGVVGNPGQAVMQDPAVKAQLAALTAAQPTLAKSITGAQTADANNAKAIAALAALTGKDADAATVKNLTAALAANTAEAQQITALANQLTTLQNGMKSLSTSIATAQQQAKDVATQTAQTSTGAASLAAQIAALQKQLATASGAGAGTAQQAAKVATGAAQLSKNAAGAASAASGLSNTVTKVGTQSKTVTSKAKDAASTVKGTSQTVSTQASQKQVASPPMTTATSDQSRRPNISWWSPLAVMAMWLGAMTMYMLFRPIGEASRTSTARPMALVAEVLAPGAVIGAVQAVIMGIVSSQVMHLGWVDGLLTTGVLLLMAAAFMTTNFVLAAVFGVLGRVISIVFALITGLGVVTNALPQVFDTLRNLSPLTPALDAIRGIAAGAPGTATSVSHLALWTAGGIAVAGLLILRARVAEAPRVATAFAG